MSYKSLLIVGAVGVLGVVAPNLAQLRPIWRTRRKPKNAGNASW
jgi:hypothetical protein